MRGDGDKELVNLGAGWRGKHGGLEGVNSGVPSGINGYEETGINVNVGQMWNLLCSKYE